MLYRLAIVSLVVGLAACGGGQKPGTDPGDGAGSGSASQVAGDDPTCPVAVPGTSVTVEDTDTGAALVFVTTGDVVAVRTRAASLATMHHDKHAAMGPMPTGDDAGSGAGGHHHHGGADGSGGAIDHGAGGGAGSMGMMIDTHSSATAEDVEGGARVVFVAAAADIAALRDELRMHAQHLANGSCAMGHP